ncbi:MAG: valine--tRNA ligase [Candidatus Dormiibacterota bacterium]
MSSEQVKVPMDKAWRPQDVEPELYRSWEEAGLFVAHADSPRPKFSIVLPPPNVTGELHLGHAVSGTIQDVYCRYRRMLGFEVLWLPGTDHAAIGTQNVIERELAKEGRTKEELGRAAFQKLVDEWYRTYGNRIVEQYKRLGATLDWTRLRFTMDPAYIRSVREAFVRLYNDGLIYRGPRIVNWCPHDRSSISDLEVDWREHEDTLYYIRYDMADGDGALVVATVRPETMLADSGVAVNPKDERYRAFIGRRAFLPLVGRELPVVGDEYVKSDFGTGALKVTPGHDPNDYEIGQRHGLPIYTAIDKDRNIVNEPWVPDELRTRDALTVRARIVEMLRDRDHLVKTEPYTHEVGHCDRCGEIIEPLVDEQWWCHMPPLRDPAVEVVTEGKTRFVPERYTKVYLDWMANLRDWNISRQLWLGHAVPVYYCNNRADHGGETYTFASVEEPKACPQCGNQKLRPDPDVLDTWFSSALWPYATMGWPDETDDLRTFFPTDVLSTAREIIFLWVARMLMTSQRFMDDIPFRTVLIHAVIQDPQGQRMSKSKGNGVDPLEMIDLYGADAVRAYGAEVGMRGQDVRFDESKIEAYQRFANKLWNMARLVLGSAEGVATRPIEEIQAAELDPAERWALSRLDAATERATSDIESFRPGDAISGLRFFAWDEIADWYLEAVKPSFRLEPTDPARVRAASVGMHLIRQLALLLHPFMPFLTEALWLKLPGGDQPIQAPREETIWPAPAGRRDEALEAQMGVLFEVVTRIRDAAKRLDAAAADTVMTSAKRVAADPSAELLDSDYGRELVARLARVEFSDAAPAARTLVVGGLEILVGARAAAPSDHAALEREVNATRAKIDTLEQRLAKEEFVSKAKPEVVQRVRDDLSAARERLAILEDAFSRA